jgi:hypothetical protein
MQCCYVVQEGLVSLVRGAAGNKNKIMKPGKLPAEAEQSRRSGHAGGRWNIWSQYKDFHPLHPAVDRAIAVPSPTNTIVRSGKTFSPFNPGQIDDQLVGTHTLKSGHELR